jgi:hypothetical protein
MHLTQLTGYGKIVGRMDLLNSYSQWNQSLG